MSPGSRSSAVRTDTSALRRSPWETRFRSSPPLTRTLIVATALASRDYQDVHHDPGLAVERGSNRRVHEHPLLQRLRGALRHRLGRARGRIEAVAIRLGAPNYPGDTMVLTGKVTAADVPAGRDDGRGVMEVAVRGANGRGDHVTGTVRLALPRAGQA